MSKISTFINLIRNNPDKIGKSVMANITRLRLARLIPDKLYLRLQFRLMTGNPLNLKDPKGFNEKLQWLKLYNRNPLYSELVDKYTVKKYVAEKIGDQYIIPTLQLWNTIDEIDIDKLPDQFVLKCTHDSGSVIICKDKSTFDLEKAKNRLQYKIGKNMFWFGREWPYKNVVPRILAEQYMEDESGELRDYKLMCFNGRVRCSFVCSDRFSGHGLNVTFFDRNWRKMPFTRGFPASSIDFPQPEHYDKMIAAAELLSKDIPFVRVDFYEIKGKLYFGEMTFFPGNGVEVFSPEKWDYILGSWINLPQKSLL